MKAMILAAGKGTRVWPVTKTIPKPMIPILRKPIMESLIEHFSKHGIEEYVVNTSYLASKIEDYFRDGSTLGVQIAYSFEGNIVNGKLEASALGSAGGMKKIQEQSGFFDETFIVVCGDAWIDLDVQAAYEFHKSKGGLATIVLKEVDKSEVHKYGVVQTDDDSRILQFQEKPKTEEAISNNINTGIYIFEPEIFDHIPSGVEYDIGSELFPALVEKGIPFYGVSLPFQWVDVGNLTDIWHATRSILNGEVSGYPIPGKEVRPGVWCGIHCNIDFDKVDIKGPVVIGSGTTIQPGVTIEGPAVIGSNCVLESGCIVRECLIDDYSWISEVVTISEKVIFGGHCINEHGEHVSISDLDIGWAINDSRCTVNDIAQDNPIVNFAKELSKKSA